MSGNTGGPAHKYLQCIDPNQIEPSEALYITALSPAAKQTLNGRTANEDTGLLLQECAVVAAALSHVMIRVSRVTCHVSRITCPGPGVNGIVNITISTESCSGCIGSGNPTGFVEGGVAVYLQVGQPATSSSSILHLLLVRANTAPSVHLWAWTIWRWWTMTMARRHSLTGPLMMTVTMMVRAICSVYLRTL